MCRSCCLKHELHMDVCYVPCVVNELSCVVLNLVSITRAAMRNA